MTAPSPVYSEWDWQYHGTCRSLSPEMFFHPEGERGAARRSRDAAAKKICLECPVLARCRDHALRAREPYGVWGGMSEEERVRAVVIMDMLHREIVFSDDRIVIPGMSPQRRRQIVFRFARQALDL